MFQQKFSASLNNNVAGCTNECIFGTTLTSSFPISDSINTAGNDFVYRTIAVTAQGLTFQAAPSGFLPASTKNLIKN